MKEIVRKAFADKILEEAKKDKDIVVVCTDSRGSGLVGAFAKELPLQFVEMGIAEQNAVSVSAGMASLGKKVYIVGPASFYSLRSAEQVKIDLAYSHNNVKIIGISGGISYGALGATHHSLQDYALMRAIPDIYVIAPADAYQMKALINTLLQDPTPAYIRIGRGAVPTLYDNELNVKIGHAISWFKGRDVGIIACGQMVHIAIEAAKRLMAEGIYTTVLDMFCIKPLDHEAVINLAKTCGRIITIEEHSIYGGLGSAVAQILATQYPVPIKILGLPDHDIVNGNDQEVFQSLGLSSEGIMDAVKNLLKDKE